MRLLRSASDIANLVSVLEHPQLVGHIYLVETCAFPSSFLPFRLKRKDVSANRLVKDLKERSLTSKVRHLSSGGTRGGIPFTQGPLFYMLRNRSYVGEVKFKGEILPGPQPPLIEHDLFRPS
ncbi:recombinase family protein [Nitrobacter winogradskyi]|uniref:Uncharacterized protein n=2 Tax=Nitrobacter winogradskyi TaxID=913 RepID=A0ACC6AJH3_NITWI|nr:hypothetical protein [Nitrobacter winogradskyi]MCP2000005.1 hypothetical protein [Nitrobacter winogradskyi]GEC16619.1 hypothetical protein NWI01_25110 [Nitrobacter winogradskyi]